jgi:hypothetical protein
VSFAAKGDALALAFIDFLRLGCDLTEQQIFCTARPGNLEPGADFTEAIREVLADAGMAIMLLSPAYYESHFCLAELGAVLVRRARRIPLLVPPVNYANLDGVQLGRQTLRINSGSDLDQMRDQIQTSSAARSVLPCGTENGMSFSTVGTRSFLTVWGDGPLCRWPTTRQNENAPAAVWAIAFCPMGATTLAAPGTDCRRQALTSVRVAAKLNASYRGN